MALEILGVALIFVAVVLCARPLGTLHGQGVQRRAHLPQPGPAPGRARCVPGHRRQRGRRADLGRYLAAVLVVTVVSVLVTFLLLRFQDRLPLQSVINPRASPAWRRTWR